MLNVSTIAVALSSLYDGPKFDVHTVVTDSRKVQEGCLFAAIKGERVDGHSFIPALDQAYENIVFLVSEQPKEKLRNPCFMVEDVREGLGRIAKAHLMQLNTKIIGVTGSVGKTTTKNFILSALNAAIKASGTAGNMNNELGVPLTALAVSDQDQAAVVEMGMRGLGQIEYLTQFVCPDIAVITNIGVAHLELLKSRANIARAKLELVDALQESGVALLNGDEPLLYQARADKKCLYFGFSEHNDYRAEHICGTTFDLQYPDGVITITLQPEGEHQIMNALAAFGVGHLMGLDAALLKQGLEAFEGDGRRMFTEIVGGVTIIDDSYNASPDSMEAALKVLASKSGRRVAVLGDMLELGSFEQQGHRQVGALCGTLGIDAVVAIGTRAKELYKALPNEMEKYYVSDREEGMSAVLQAVSAGDTVLFKASNSMNFQQLANSLKERMKNQ